MTLLKLVRTVVAALEEIKARDIEVLDVTKITTLFDRMIIASGDSTRQTRAIANNVAEKVKAGGGEVYGVEGEQAGEWILVDLGDVLVHVMQSAVRAHYNLEELWAEAKRLNKTVSAARSRVSAAPSAGRHKAARAVPTAPAEPESAPMTAAAPEPPKKKTVRRRASEA
jgi:ribosome-associated protein